MSSKDPIGSNIDYATKSTIGYHLKGHSTIKKFLSLFKFDNVSILVSAMKKRYKRVTMDWTLELLIYKGFLLSEAFRATKA